MLRAAIPTLAERLAAWRYAFRTTHRPEQGVVDSVTRTLAHATDPRRATHPGEPMAGLRAAEAHRAPPSPPPDNPVWPLWWAPLAFVHTRRAGGLLILGLLSRAVWAAVR